MPGLTVKDVEQVYTTDGPKMKYPSPKHYMERPSFDTVPYRGKKLTGTVVCEGAAIDALKGYGVCKLVDKSGEPAIVAGWVVDLDPSKSSFWEPWSTDKYPVRYEFCFRRDAIDEVNIEIDSLREEIMKKLKEGKGRYVCVGGPVVNPRIYLAESGFVHGGLIKRVVREFEESV